jgi:hypothetical protein
MQQVSLLALSFELEASSQRTLFAHVLRCSGLTKMKQYDSRVLACVLFYREHLLHNSQFRALAKLQTRGKVECNSTTNSCIIIVP